MSQTPPVPPADIARLAPGQVRVFVTSFCPYCVAAKRWLTTRGVPFEVVDVSRDFDTRRWLVEKTRMQTVPQIFVGSESVGGYDDLVALDARGEFFPLLDAQGVPHGSV